MSLSMAEQAEMENLEARIRAYMRQDWLSAAERADYDAATQRLDELKAQDTSTNVDSPLQTYGGSPEDNAPPADADLSVPVAPTGGVETGSGNGPDLSQPVEYAPPVAGQTEFLPLTGNDQYDETIRALDKALVNVNDTAFNLNPDDLWNPDSATLGGPTGPSTISGLSPVSEEMSSLNKQVSEQFSSLGDTINSSREGTWPARLREMYVPTLESADAGVAAGGPAANAAALTGESGGGAANTFSAFHAAISDARHSIAGLYGVDENGDRYLDTSRALNPNPEPMQQAQGIVAGMTAANEALSTAIDPWNISTRLSGDSAGDVAVTPASGAPAAPSPSSGGSFGSSGGSSSPSGGLENELDSLLGGGTPASQSPMPTMPQMPTMPTMPQMPDMSSFGGAEAPQDSEPLKKAGDTELTSDTNAAEARPHTPTAAPAAPSTAPEGIAASSAVFQNAIPKPGDPVRPGALGADGKPLDKDGDGKMDKDALAATRENADPNKDGIRDKFTITIDTATRSVDVLMDDPRLAEMMTRLAEADNNAPVEILDAAKASGLDLENLGEKIDTMAIRPGDVVTGTDTGMYMGDGLVLTEHGEVKSLVDVMDYRVSDPEVFRLPVPDLPSSDEVIPDEAVAAAAESPSPPGAPEPQAAAEPPSPESGAPAAAPSPAPDPVAAEPFDALAAMLDGGDDNGVPEVAYQGHALGGTEDNGITEVAYQGRALG